MNDQVSFIKEILDHMLEGCQIIGFDWVYLYINDAGAHHARKEKSDLLGRRMMDVYPGIENSPMFKTLSESMDSRTANKLVNEFEYPDGVRAWFQLSIHPVPEGLLVMSLDITEHIMAQERIESEYIEKVNQRKSAEEEIRRLNAELELRIQERTAELVDLYNNAPCGYHSLDGDGLFVRINDTELNWLGYNRQEMIGKIKFSNLLTAESVQIFQENFPLFKKRGWVNDLEFDMVRKDGSILPVLLSATAITDQEGDYLMSRSTISDNTARKQAEAAMRESQARIEDTNKELEAFAYSISHDLRAPLRAIDGFSRIIMKDYANILDAEGKRLLNVVRTNTQRMDQLITDLLALSRISRIDMKLSPIDMATLANSIYHEIALPEVQQKFTFSISPMPDACGDPTMIRQVWTNLLSNAIKYTLPKESRTIEVGGYRERGVNIYYVKDSGVGFNPDYTHKLFNVFQRLHRADDFEGTGIGLAIVRRVIYRHGGLVRAEGKINQGAAFYFSLPERELNHGPAK